MLVVSSSLHIRSNDTVSRIMLDSYSPSTSNDRSVYFWTECLKLILISVASAIGFEALTQKYLKRYYNKWF